MCLAKKTDLNSKITEIESKITSITNLANNSALIVVENKIPNVSSLVKKTDCNAKISETQKTISDHNHDKYITTSEFNTLVAGVFTAGLAQEDLVTKTDFDTKLQDISKRITSNKAKHLVQIKTKKLKTFDLSYFKGKCHFEEDGTQNYLVFQPMYSYFKRVAGVDSGNYIYFLKYKGLSDERINSNTVSYYSITPELSHYDFNSC